MPTALELSRKKWKSYVEAARHRPTPPELTPAEQQIRERLISRIREVATVLKTRFGARRVILFGSLVHSWFTPNSDVDLVVEGLTGNDYWDAWRLIEEIIGERPVDLIDLETASESLQKAIQRSGIEL